MEASYMEVEGYVRADFERNGLSSLITVSVRDIQGEGFPEEHEGRVDAVFLDLPQPWLAVPSASKCLKPDAVLTKRTYFLSVWLCMLDPTS
ncbi:tRNA (adenine(58)-N(1))-methyltransferase catalytic subunit trmt61a [Carex littledalei]|uniref:tRNA (adenine(58)-N(1))-methyltransferase n=1 Tax=Carex littledalei TaxID=544730 RepID=A0A833QTE9_9POAL|nr:tRNA (adenine(58)-N(1))-methyltransferase catalytic subunit trmt61a [Carex littledalei]